MTPHPLMRIFMLIEDLRKIFENEQLTQILSDNFKGKDEIYAKFKKINTKGFVFWVKER